MCILWREKMKIIKTIKEMKRESGRLIQDKKSIGLVPTMGFLHEGHLSLVRKSVKTMDVTVVSVFVNPTQFAPHEDFGSYPRDYERDMTLLQKEGVAIVFSPERGEIYPRNYKTYVEVHDLQNKLCGMSRPTFFRGVCTIVLKLFNIIGPDTAFFGQKDAQQSIIIKRMVRDLDLDIKIEVLPILRDKDGLALSSRNIYLTKKQRLAALSLSQSLREAERMVRGGEIKVKVLIERMKNLIELHPEAKIDYISIVDPESLEALLETKPGALAALAVTIGKARLIDNTFLP